MIVSFLKLWIMVPISMDFIAWNKQPWNYVLRNWSYASQVANFMVPCHHEIVHLLAWNLKHITMKKKSMAKKSDINDHTKLKLAYVTIKKMNHANSIQVLCKIWTFTLVNLTTCKEQRYFIILPSHSWLNEQSKLFITTYLNWTMHCSIIHSKSPILIM
jgi:hypothetical protein